MVRVLNPTFNDFATGVTQQDFIDKISLFVNRSEYDLRCFAFKIFDVHFFDSKNKNPMKVKNMDKITEESLFTFINFFKDKSMLAGEKKDLA